MGQFVQRIRARADAPRVMAKPAQLFDQKPVQGGIIFDDKDAPRAGAGSGWGHGAMAWAEGERASTASGSGQ